MFFAVNDLILKKKQRTIEKNIQINQPLSEVSNLKRQTFEFKLANILTFTIL